MTTHQAKKIIRAKLEEYGLQNRLTARTVSFSDLARGSCIFVCIHGLVDSRWSELKAIAHANGFCLEG